MAFAKVIFQRCVLLLIAGVVVGCNGPDLIVRLRDEDPLICLPAIREAGQTGDRRTLPCLVELLGDEEGDVRVFSVGALRKITGESMGYHSYDPLAQRAAAQHRWLQWLIDKGLVAQAPSKPEDSAVGEKHE